MSPEDQHRRIQRVNVLRIFQKKEYLKSFFKVRYKTYTKTYTSVWFCSYKALISSNTCLVTSSCYLKNIEINTAAVDLLIKWTKQISKRNAHLEKWYTICRKKHSGQWFRWPNFRNSKVERFQSFTSQSKISSKVNEYRSTDNSLNIAKVHSHLRLLCVNYSLK